jgi:phosphoenolpyruvate carboxykinase (ATP)
MRDVDVSGMAMTQREIAARLGLANSGNLYVNLSDAALYEEAVRRREGLVAREGPLVVTTGVHTGRSPQDKYFVEESTSRHLIDWGGTNKRLESEKFDRIYHRLLSHLKNRDLFVQDLYLGADPLYRLPVRVVTEYAWHSLFVRTLFIRPSEPIVHSTTDLFTIIDVPSFIADPEKDGTRSEVFIIVNFEKRLVLIGGTSYAGEMKKSGFTIMNHLLPQRGVFPMHCSANVGNDGDVALFFGLSGTGKTTLSADPQRILLGDDEHGWSERGVFNFEGGCYAKVIRLSQKAEPEIYRTTRMFGTILENVVIDERTREIDLDDMSLTENTRAAYPISFISNSSETGIAGHPKNIIFLTADAFGIMPPVARLSPEQAMYHFLSGYTAKVAGTEKGIGKEPEATFSTCFGAPFLPQHPTVYAKMLGERMKDHKTDAWLVNTGWTGGAYGVGERVRIADTRAIIRAIHQGVLSRLKTVEEPVFGFQIPTVCPGISTDILNPRKTWKNGLDYDKTARELAVRFRENFQRFVSDVSEDVRLAGPMPVT